MSKSDIESRLRTGSMQLIALTVPLAVAPGLLYSAVDLPKRILLEILVIAAWACAVSRLGPAQWGGFRRAGAALPLAAVCLWAATTSMCAANARLALEMAELQLAYAGLAAAAMFLVAWDEIRKIMRALMAAAGIAALYGILQYAGVDFLPWDSSWGSRCFGTVGNPVFFGGFLSPVLVFIAACWLKDEDEERKDLYSLLIVGLFLALLFSQTRGAWLGCLAGLFALILALWRRFPGGGALLARNRWRLAALAVFGLAAIGTVSSKAILGADALPLDDRIKDSLNVGGWSVRHRFVLWRAAGVMLRDAPFTGVGLGHYRSAFPSAQAEFREAYTSKGFFFAPKETNAHNDYAQLAAEQGLIGLGLWLWLLWAAFRRGLRVVEAGGEKGAWAAGMLGGCCSLLAAALFNFPFRVIPSAMVFWLFVGALGSVPGRGPAVYLRRRPRKRAFAVAAGLGLLLSAWISVPALRADRFYAKGIYYHDANMWEMSAQAFGKSVAARPYDNLARYWLGSALFRASAYSWTGELWDKALVQFNKARELGLNDELLFNQMALVFEKRWTMNAASK